MGTCNLPHFLTTILCSPVSFALSSIVPSTGGTGGGTAVTLYGTGFLFGAAVSFGGLSGSSTVFVDSNTITSVTPAHAPASVDVTVTNGDVALSTSTLTNGFTYS